MFDSERYLVTGALIKWQQGEALSEADMQRILNLFEHNDPRMEMMDPATVAGLQQRWRSILMSKLPKQ